MYSRARRTRERAPPVFALWSAPPCPHAASEERAQTEEGHNKGRRLAKTPNSLVHSLHQALLSAQEKVEQLARENAGLTAKELGDHEALRELTSLHIQAKREKEEVEAKVKEMEEDFQKEKSCWEDLRRSQLEEINSFRNQWLAAQSHNQLLEEEVRESTQELSECRRQVDRNITSIEDILCRQRQETAARISALDDYWGEVVRVREECAGQRISQLEEEVAEKRRLIHSLTDNLANKSDCRHDKGWESKLSALEEKYRRALVEREETWQERVQEMERTNELWRTWLQKEGEWRQRADALQDEIQRLNRELQGLNGKKKKRKQWWKRRLSFGRRTQRRNTEGASEEASLLASCAEVEGPSPR